MVRAPAPPPPPSPLRMGPNDEDRGPEADHEDGRPEARRRLRRLRPPTSPSSSAASVTLQPRATDVEGQGQEARSRLRRLRSRTCPASSAASLTPQPRAGAASASPTSGPPPPPPRRPAASSSQEGINLNWNGPGLHRFNAMEDLLLSVGDLNRFFSCREGLCMLQNARHFVNNGLLYDASDDPRRRDFEFLVVSRRTFLDMAARSSVRDGRFWPGYKENYYDMSEERRISTLKLDEHTFIWRHEVSGFRLLRRRISLDKDEEPFEDEDNVFYVLQYQKLPRMKKSKKARVLEDRARNGYF